TGGGVRERARGVAGGGCGAAAEAARPFRGARRIARHLLAQRLEAALVDRVGDGDAAPGGGQPPLVLAEDVARELSDGEALRLGGEDALRLREASGDPGSARLPLSPQPFQHA